MPCVMAQDAQTPFTAPKRCGPRKIRKKCHIFSFSPLLSGVHFGKLSVYFSYANKRNGQIQRDKKRMG
jgi:hypothetical protein